MGDIVTDRLNESFANLMDYGFTAGMERASRRRGPGRERDWKHLLDEFFTAISRRSSRWPKSARRGCAPTSRP